MNRVRSEPSLFQDVAKSQSYPIDTESKATTAELIGPYKLNEVHPVNCLDAIKQLPNDCLDVVITSPPYWGQRGNNGIGQEEDPRDYVQNLATVLTEIMRCLKPSGTLWLNQRP